VTTEPSLATLKAMQQQHHPGCVVCSGKVDGLDLDFRLVDDGTVEALLDCPATLQGYPDRLHGGVLCALLDGAMTNCLFAHGLAAVTAKLDVRFRHPAILGKPAVVRAWISQQLDPLFRLDAKVVQAACVIATAKGTFVNMEAVGSLPFQFP